MMLLRCMRPIGSLRVRERHAVRALSTTNSAHRIDVKLVSALRKEMGGVSLAKVKEALQRTENNIDEARALLRTMLADEARRREAKGLRTTAEGVVSIVHRPGIGAAMVELCCETDFVARTDMFQNLAAQIARTCLFLHQQQTPGQSGGSVAQQSVQVQDLLHMPILAADVASLSDAKPTSTSATAPAGTSATGQAGELVQDAMKRVSGQLGETLRLRRGVIASAPVSNSHCKMFVGAHGLAVAPSTVGKVKQSVGTMGAIVVVQPSFAVETAAADAAEEALGNQLIAHVIGMQPSDTRDLLQQPFLFDPERTIEQVLQQQHWNMVEFVRFAMNQPPTEEEAVEKERMVA